MIFASRRRRAGPDPFLAWKMRLFVAGAVFLALAMALDRPVIALASVAVLLVALALRAIGERRADEAEAEAAADDEEAPPPA